MGVDIIYCYGRGAAPSNTESLLVNFTVDVETDTQEITDDENDAMVEVLWRESVVSVARSSCSEAATILGDDIDFSLGGTCDISNSGSTSCVSYEGAVTITYSTETSHTMTEGIAANALDGINRTISNGKLLDSLQNSIENISNTIITEVHYFDRSKHDEDALHTDNSGVFITAGIRDGTVVAEEARTTTPLVIGMAAFGCLVCISLILFLFFYRQKRSQTRRKSFHEPDVELTLPHEGKNIPGEEEYIPHEDFEMLYVPHNDSKN